MTDSLLILGCSGPGAGQAIARSIAIGYYSAAATAFMTFWLFRLSARTGRGWPANFSLLLLALHPAWTISAIGGDCGFMKVMLAGFVLSLTVGFLVLQIVTTRKYKQDA